jgi:3-isopropylmalate dehydratase
VLSLSFPGKNCLLNGLDDIGITLEKMEDIRDFETKRSEIYPWLDGATTRVPQIFHAKGMPMQEALETPTPEQWRTEVLEQRRKARA